MAIQASDIVDLVNGTLAKYKKGVKLTFENPRYEFMNTFMAKEDTLFEGAQTGTSFKGNIQLTDSDAAENVGLHQQSAITIQDFTQQWDCPWRHSRTHWGFALEEEAMNSGEERIMNVVATRRAMANMSFANRVENAVWVKVLSTEDTKQYSFPYYLPGLDDAQAGEGFYGCLPSYAGGTTTGFTTVLGIAPSTAGSNTTTPTGGYARWRSYAAGGTGYYATGGFDLTALDTAKNMFDRINFQAPKGLDDKLTDQLGKFRLYTNLHVIREMERLARNQNADVGPDLAEYMGRTAFRRLVPRYVPQLDADMRDPFYMINLNDFKVRALKGRWNVEDKAVQVDATIPTDFVVWKYWSWNLACENRRGSGVMRKTAART